MRSGAEVGPALTPLALKHSRHRQPDHRASVSGVGGDVPFPRGAVVGEARSQGAKLGKERLKVGQVPIQAASSFCVAQCESRMALSLLYDGQVEMQLGGVRQFRQDAAVMLCGFPIAARALMGDPGGESRVNVNQFHGIHFTPND